MNTHIYLGPDAVSELIRYCHAQGLSRFLIVSDDNTYPILGQRVEASLRDRGWSVRTVILRSADLAADEQSIVEVLYHTNGEQLTCVAVGSGTITDITRYASYCARNPFISVPTAPSMDGYASHGAALTLGGHKVTVASQSPLAICADLPTLCAAPPAMIAAGFGDMLGKYTSLADWRLGALLVGERFSPEIARRAERGLHNCVEHVGAIGHATPEGIRRLMEGLLESGVCMAEFGNSRPASGSEHCLSHFWEMRVQPHRRPMLHGAKVGIGTILMAGRYEAIRRVSPEEAVRRLETAPPPSIERELVTIRNAYGAVADRIIGDYGPFLQGMADNWAALSQRIANHWHEIQTIAASVPPAHTIAGLLAQAGGPTEPRAIGLTEQDVDQALRFSLYVRSRFTVDTLGRLLGVVEATQDSSI